MKKVNGILTKVNNKDLKLLKESPKEFWAGVSNIGDEAFQGLELEEIEIPNTVKSIGEYAFNACYKLKKIKLHEGLESIASAVFSYCTSLEEIEIPDTVKIIGHNCFYDCENLKSAKLPNHLNGTLGEGVFFNCLKLTDVNLPENLKEIPNGTFGLCKNLAKITIPSSVEKIGLEAFAECENLRNVNLPNGLKHINTRAFCYAGLTEITIPDTVKAIKREAFAVCSNLKKVNLSNRLKNINKGVFYKTGLTEITIPSSVEIIRKGAFAQCSSLNKVNFSNGLKSIEETAFYKTDLTEVIIPDTVEKIDRYVFWECPKLKNLKVRKNVEMADNIFYDTDGLDWGYLTITDKDYIFSTKPSDSGKCIPYIVYRNIKDTELETNIEKLDLKTFNNEMKPFKNDIDMATPYNRTVLYNFAYALGCCSSDKLRDKNGNELEATKGQKRSSLLASILGSKALSLNDIEKCFYSLPVKLNISDEAVKFISNTNKKEYPNIQLLKRLSEEYTGMFARVMADFDTAQASRITLDEKGMPTKLSWEQAFINYFNSKSYDGVTEENEDIAYLFNKKSLTQENFNEAVELRKQAKKNKVPHHILNKQLREPTLLETIEKNKKETVEILKDNKQLINGLYEKKFTYEMLDKYDPHNAIMGIFTSCCATITSNAYGGIIAKKSVLSKDLQNLVVRDMKDKIVGKGTIYVDQENSYGIINDFEINEQFKKDEIYKESKGGYYSSAQDSQISKDRELIFQALMRGVNAFVEEYDRQNPKNPLKQINVGMGYNRLKEQCKRFEEATELLTVPEDYMFEDAKQSQHILYKRDAEKQTQPKDNLKQQN